MAEISWCVLDMIDVGVSDVFAELLICPALPFGPVTDPPPFATASVSEMGRWVDRILCARVLVDVIVSFHWEFQDVRVVFFLDWD